MFSIAATLLTTAILVMVIYIGFRFVQTNKTPAPAPISPVVTAPAPDPGRAFVQHIDAADATDIGASYSVTFETNTWAVCAVDVYRPDETLLTITKEAAKPRTVAPGRMQWTWNVPTDAERGTWLLRFLCGSSQDLATIDRSVEVR